ncbi:MAG: hypothetical protein PHI83_09200 [Sphaerochaetaceae bacterium]|nr:hypothetical protein [Sphaerochaetaceae bacterium]
MRNLLELLVLLTVLCSCSVTQSIRLEQDLGGDADMKVESSDFFDAVLLDLSPATGDDAMEATMKALAVNLELAGATSLRQDGLGMSFSFINLPATLSLLAGRALDSIIRFSEQDGLNTMIFHLDMDNYHLLEEAIPFLSEPNFQVYGPVYNSYMDDSEYLEMMDFIFGPDASENIMASSISIVFSVPGIIESASSQALDESSFSYSFPLMDFLMLKKPLECTCTWKAF